MNFHGSRILLQQVFLEKNTGSEVSLAGIPAKVLPKVTRKGDKMAIVTLEDLNGSIEVILWPEIYSAYRKYFI